MFMFTIEGGSVAGRKARTLLDWVIRPRLRTVPGVADVNSLGGLVRTFEVIPNTATGRTRPADRRTATALETNNRNDGAGRLADGEESLLVRRRQHPHARRRARHRRRRTRRAIPVRVGDVADVRIGSLTRYGAVTRNGKGETVEGLVLGLRGANARRWWPACVPSSRNSRRAARKGVTIEVFYDRGHLVERAVGTVSKALIEAIVLVVSCWCSFLGNLRAAIVVALTLPLAALVTFILMHRFGMSANLMSLGGLAIAIGMLVDAAVVVVENIESHLAHEPGEPPLLQVIYRAVREVAVPVASGIVIIVIVFPAAAHPAGAGRQDVHSRSR
jgi:cobalt-zinc-cadmium resistance protein CzcA